MKKEEKKVDGKLKIPIFNDEQLGYIQDAMLSLSKAGVTFDNGYDIRTNTFEWELDWSLEGAELVVKRQQSNKVKGEKKQINHNYRKGCKRN